MGDFGRNEAAQGIFCHKSIWTTVFGLFGLSTMKQKPEKQGCGGGRFTWTQILKENQGKYDLHLLNKHLYHMLWTISLYSACHDFNCSSDKEAMNL